MEVNNETMNWYLAQCSEDNNEYYGILLENLRRYHIDLRTAAPQQRCFIEEVSRIAFQRNLADRLGLPYSVVQPAFSA